MFGGIAFAFMLVTVLCAPATVEGRKLMQAEAQPEPVPGAPTEPASMTSTPAGQPVPEAQPEPAPGAATAPASMPSTVQPVPEAQPEPAPGVATGPASMPSTVQPVPEAQPEPAPGVATGPTSMPSTVQPVAEAQPDPVPGDPVMVDYSVQMEGSGVGDVAPENLPAAPVTPDTPTQGASVPASMMQQVMDMNPMGMMMNRFGPQ